MNSGHAYDDQKSWCTFCNLKNDYNNIQLCKKCQNSLDIKESDVLDNSKDINGKIIALGKTKKLLILTPSAYKRIKSRIIKEKKERTLIDNKRERKILLHSKLKELKLEYKKHSICDVFLKYGTPDIDTVLKTLEQDNMIKSNNLMKLSRELGKYKLEYDDKVPSYINYVKNGGDLDDTIKIGKVEQIVMKSTNYLTYLKEYSNDDALDMAAIEYIESNGSNSIVSDYIESITTLNF